MPERAGAERPAYAHLPTGLLSARRLTVRVAGGELPITLVSVPLGSVRLKVGLAHGKVGCIEHLADIAQRHGALAAINGSFFDAYSGKPIRNPYGTLISGGRLLHLADHPTMLYCYADGRVDIAQSRYKIVGGLDGKTRYPDNWYAYGLNSLPERESWAEIYTSDWGSSTTPKEGVQVIVRGGVVRAVERGPRPIPSDGYAIHLRGKETYLVDRLRPGRRCTYKVGVERTPAAPFAPAAIEGVGAGPLLVQHGKVQLAPAAEGFRDPKIVSRASGRSAVGVTRDGYLLLVTCRAATIAQLAAAMEALGCDAAMNLDGGASSGLWLQGQSYLTEPGRPVSNALLVLSR